MATFHFELVSPEKISFSGEVDQVDVPGAEGDFGVLAGHAPLIALIRPGIMTVTAAGEQTNFFILTAFTEIDPLALPVLVDIATSLEDLDREMLQAQISKLEQDVKDLAQGSELDRQIARLDHFKSLNRHIEGTAMH